MTTQSTCLEVLTWLDSIVDGFNGNYDPAPKNDPFRARSTVYRKSLKYECEDLDDVIQSFFEFCSSLELKPGQTEAYRQAFMDAVAIQRTRETLPERLEFWDKYLKFGLEALTLHPKAPLAAMRRVSKHQLWLRVALKVDPQLPAPWPSWPLYLKDGLDRANANFRGGSENWTYENHDDATWAQRKVLDGMKSKGWFDPAEAERLLDPEMTAVIKAARKAKLASIGVHEVTQKDLEEWLYDPIADRWVQHKDLPSGVLSWQRDTRVLTTLPGWTSEQEYQALVFSHKVSKGTAKVPPMPGPGQIDLPGTR